MSIHIMAIFPIREERKMTTRYKAVIIIPINNNEVLEAENLFPNVPSVEALKLLMDQIYIEQTGKSYEEDGSTLEIVEVH
jgi:hypothetical protein